MNLENQNGENPDLGLPENNADPRGVETIVETTVGELRTAYKVGMEQEAEVIIHKGIEFLPSYLKYFLEVLENQVDQDFKINLGSRVK